MALFYKFYQILQLNFTIVLILVRFPRLLQRSKVSLAHRPFIYLVSVCIIAVDLMVYVPKMSLLGFCMINKTLKFFLVDENRTEHAILSRTPRTCLSSSCGSLLKHTKLKA